MVGLAVHAVSRRGLSSMCSEGFRGGSESLGEFVAIMLMVGIVGDGSEDAARVGDVPASPVGVDLIDHPVPQPLSPVVVRYRSQELFELAAVKLGGVHLVPEVDVGEVAAKVTELTEFGEFFVKFLSPMLPGPLLVTELADRVAIGRGRRGGGATEFGESGSGGA